MAALPGRRATCFPVSRGCVAITLWFKLEHTLPKLELMSLMMGAPSGLECGENLSTFDASPEKPSETKAQATQDAAALLVLLSQSAEPEPESDDSEP